MPYTTTTSSLLSVLTPAAFALVFRLLSTDARAAEPRALVHRECGCPENQARPKYYSTERLQRTANCNKASVLQDLRHYYSTSSSQRSTALRTASVASRFSKAHLDILMLTKQFRLVYSGTG